MSFENAWIGEYRITELLGAGGMGEVYKAVHVHLGRVIAVKALSPGLADTASLHRFYAEANIQASLQHPGVAEYLGFHECQGRPCILMEFVDGETLASILKRGPLPIRDAARIMREIASVAAHFHAQGVVHRDLKSHNIKVTSAGRVKVLDFGIARYQNADRLTRTGAVIGTPQSLAPEQVRGEGATQAADVWQLGVLFYELLTGRLPFQADTTHETFARILNAPCPSVIQSRSDTPPALERILARCLEKDPARRYHSGGELYRALEEWEASAELPAAPPRDRRALIASLAGVAVLAAIFGIVQLVRDGSDNPAPPGTAAPVSVSPQPPPDAAPAVIGAETVTVDTMDGVADVYREGRLVGTTPFRVEARQGERIELTLRRNGFKDRAVEFEPSQRHEYTYTLEPLQGR
jgi:eukaryotic-like serine/threonine-protein kinase